MNRAEFLRDLADRQCEVLMIYNGRSFLFKGLLPSGHLFDFRMYGSETTKLTVYEDCGGHPISPIGDGAEMFQRSVEKNTIKPFGHPVDFGQAHETMLQMISQSSIGSLDL